MKPTTKTLSFSILLAACALTAARPASADDANNVYEVSEDTDAWLHGHCAFLGTFVTKDDRTRLLDGEVAILVAQMGDGARLAKRFACKEKPVFYTEAFVAAECAKLPEKDKARCEVKFPPPAPPPSSVAPAAPPVAPAVEPPAAPTKKSGRSQKPGPPAHPGTAVVRTAGF